MVEFKDDRSNEERVALTPLFMEEGLNALRTKLSSQKPIPLKDIDELLNVQAGNEDFMIYQELMELVKLADAHRAEGNVYGDSDVVKHLLPSVGEKRLAAFFHWLRHVPGMTERAISLRRALDEEMESLWLQSKVSPDIVFRMLPIAAEEKLTGDVVNHERWPIIKDGLTRWFRYVIKFNDRHRVQKYDSNSVVDLMVNKRGTEEAVAFFYSLRKDLSMENFANSCQMQLAEKHPQTIKLMLHAWLMSEVYPSTVYKMMFFEENDILEHGVGDREIWPRILEKIRLWLKYVDDYNHQKFTQMSRQERYRRMRGYDEPFNPGLFVHTPLMRNSKKSDLVEFLQYLQDDKNTRSFASWTQESLGIPNIPEVGPSQA